MANDHDPKRVRDSRRSDAVYAESRPGLGIYVHVPFCRHVCPYCDFYKVAVGKAGRGARGRYTLGVIREIRLLAEAFPGAWGRALDSIYFGGGTPSSLEVVELEAILDAIRSSWSAARGCEITLEANPETMAPGRLRAWRAAGFNRLSVGVQAFDDGLLVKIGRGHTAAMVRRALRRARDAGFDNLSVDLMFALPGQTVAQWMESIEATIGFGPEHISFYGLTLHPGTRFHAMHEAGGLALPDEDAQAEMYLAARRRLIEAGYEHYEISNFARPGRRARHNENYWLEGDWLAAGPSAHGSVDGWRWENPRSLEEWEAALRRNQLPHVAPPSPLEEEELRVEAVMLGLRRAEGLDLDAVASRTGFDLRRDRRAALRRLVEAGLVWREGNRLGLTERGFLVADAIMAELS